MVNEQPVISGILLDKFSGTNVHISSKVIVCRLATSNLGKPTRTYSLRYQWGQNNLQSQHPLVVIFGRGVFESYGLPAGVQPDIQYITVGFWTVISMWSVRNATGTDIIIRLRHISEPGESWMNSINEHLESNPTNSKEGNNEQEQLLCHTVSGETCRSCGIYSEPVYTEMWVCLSSSCQRFCRNNEGGELPTNRTLSTAFITAPSITKELVTPKLTRESRASFQMSLSDEENQRNFRDFWRGDCCPRCRMASHSSSYAKQICPGCGYTRDVKPPIVPLSYYTKDDNDASSGSATVPLLHYQISPSSSDCITSESPKEGAEYYIYRFRLHLEDEIILMRPKKGVRTAARGVDEIYQEIQLQKDKGDVNVRRRLLGNSGSQIHVTRHMIEKYGREYNAGYGPGFITFDDPCATTINKMRLTVERAIRSELNSDLEFNEGVLCTYFSGMAMGIHADDEVGLRPYVASLALGASAEMEFYMKPEYDSGKSGETGLRLLQNNPLIKGCQQRTKLLELKERHSRGEIDQITFEAEWQSIIAQNRFSKRSPRKIFQFTQQHGDIVLQRGEGVQKYYLHAIKQLLSLCRDSLTLRYVEDEHEVEGNTRGKEKINRKRGRSPG